MTKLITILCALALNITGAQAEEAAPKPPPAQKTINANIYEKEKANSLSGKVKTTKTSREDTLVYFEGIKKSGPYVLSSTLKNYTKLKNRLVKSSEANGPKVTVSLDDQDNIMTVEISETADTSDGTKD